MIEDDPRIGQLFSRTASQPQGIQWDSRKFAIISDRTFMKFTLNDPQNFDPVTGRPRLVILDDFTLGVRISESIGTEDSMEAISAGIWSSNYSRVLYFFEGVDIGIAELDPAWYALGIGWRPSLLGCLYWRFFAHI